MFRQPFVLAVSAALLATLTVAAPAGSAPAEQAALNAASFKDAAGDSGAAPDFTGVDVGNDVVAGPIVFWIKLENRSTDLTGDDVVFLLIDVDRNPETGDEDGAEYAVGVDAESVWIDRWDGEAYVEMESSSLAATFFRSDRFLRVTIHPADLGGPSSFDFFVLSFAGEDVDAAPNGPPWWSYTLAGGRPSLLALGLLLNPKAPAAGKALTATMAVGRGDTLGLLDQGKVTCRLLVGGKALKAARAAFAQGLPQCRWNLPRAAKGKALKGTISASFGGSTAKKSFSARAK
ncbi:MAG: hypothetical protein WD981_07490 [Gaiellaceae bacterium]